MRKETVKLPSGLTITLRGKTLEEDTALTDQSRGRTFDDICFDLLTACTVSVEDTGPKEDVLDENGKLDWNKVLRGDFLAAIFAFRRLSFKDGHLYDIDVNCPRCGKRLEWQANLNMLEDGGDIVDYPLPDDSADKMMRGELFEVEVDGKVVSFRLQTVADAKKNSKAIMQSGSTKGARANALRQRILGVSGIEEGNDVIRWLRKLEDADVQVLQEAMEAEDCGIDDEIEIECPHFGCGAEFMATVPFDASFLMPSNQKRSRRKDRMRQIRERS
jgi:hypothetical protein